MGCPEDDRCWRDYIRSIERMLVKSADEEAGTKQGERLISRKWSQPGRSVVGKTIARKVVVAAKKHDPHPRIGLGCSTEEDPIDRTVRVVPRG